MNKETFDIISNMIAESVESTKEGQKVVKYALELIEKLQNEIDKLMTDNHRKKVHIENLEKLLADRNLILANNSQSTEYHTHPC